MKKLTIAIASLLFPPFTVAVYLVLDGLQSPEWIRVSVSVSLFLLWTTMIATVLFLASARPQART